MRAAIYCRKSTDEGDKHAEAKSVTRQLEQGRGFAESKGWSVVHEYVDDGISGALDETKRPGLRAMLHAAEAHTFDILIVAQSDRLGRDQWVVGGILAKLAKAGVRLWTYQTDREVYLSGAVGKFMAAVDALGSEFYRESMTRHMVDSLRAKAKNG